MIINYNKGKVSLAMAHPIKGGCCVVVLGDFLGFHGVDWGFGGLVQWVWWGGCEVWWAGLGV